MEKIFESFGDFLNESKVDYIKKFQKQVNLVNSWIEQANKDDILAIEPDSTWESPYEFEPLELTPKKLIVKYKEDYVKPKKEDILFSRDVKNDFEDIKYIFSWIKRAIKKGYREEGKVFKLK